MRSPHPSYRWERRESHRANQVYALATHQLQVERGERDIEPIQVDALATHQLQVERRESHRANQVDALATTQATGLRGERVIEPVKWMRLAHTSATGGEEEERES